MLLAFGCSAPPGSEDADGPPEFNGGLPNTGAVTPGTVPPAGAAPPAASPTGAGGSGSEAVGAGVGLQPAPAQNQNAGQNQGTGGSAMVPPPAPNAGAGGSSMAAGGAGMVPANPPPAGEQPPPNQPPPQNPPPVEPPPVVNSDCAAQFFCDGFEGVAAGASPSDALWGVVDNFSIAEASPKVQVSAANAHSGGQALRVSVSRDTGAGRTGIVTELPLTRYFVRAWLQIDSAPVGPVFIGAGTDQNSEVRLRIQGQSFATINVVPSDGVRPGNANGGGCPECVTLTPNEWFCAELFIDDASRSSTLWIDGVEAASVVNGDPGWATQPATPTLFLGSWDLQGGLTSAWIDDVAAGPERIGCD